MASGGALGGKLSHSSTRDSDTISATQEVQDTVKENNSSLKSDPASAIGDTEPDQNQVDLQMEQDYIQILEAPLDPSPGLHGVLRYRRELRDTRISLQPQLSLDHSVLCEFCGKRAKPPLDLIDGKEPKDFCCLQYKEVFEEVVQERRFVLELCKDRPSGTQRTEDISSAVEKELELGAGEWDAEEHRLQQGELERIYREAQARLSSEDNVFHTKTIHFQLSGCAPEQDSQSVKKDSSKDKTKLWDNTSGPGPGPAGFGLNHHQDNVGVIQKFYSNGDKFLTAFPDGSAQVFYPSGNLAIILLTNEKERVCVIHDDISSHCPIRALFQSSGRATCYHGNGRVWLNMDLYGGQSLDEDGARSRRWSWSDHSQTPTSLRPTFLSLNKHVGVRVLGRQCVFVSFLALGQQARFSVGSCVESKDISSPPRGPSLCREELMLFACRLYLRQTLARLRWCQRFPSSPRHRNLKPSPVLQSLGQKLLMLSHSVTMKDTDRNFIQHCLQDCQ